MEDLQTWFAPLLWIMGTIGAIAAFCRLCKPVWTLLQSPKEVCKQLQALDEKVENHFVETNKRMDTFNGDLKEIKNDIENLRAHQKTSDSGTESLLRDRILQIHRYLMGKESISQDEYESVSSMFDSYKALGGNHFVDRLMSDIDKKDIITTLITETEPYL